MLFRNTSKEGIPNVVKVGRRFLLLQTTRQDVCQFVVLSDVQTNPWPWLKSTSLVAREILFTRDATETTFSSLHTPLSSFRSMLLWIVLSTLSHLVCLSVADGVIASESCFPAGRDIRACYYSGPFQTRSECLVTIESRL